jgi:type IV pilus assembly protein PilE
MNAQIITHGQPFRTPRIRGFTLVELMVTMLVAAILIGVAIPSYSSYVRKSRRTEAKTAVLDVASLEERFYSTNNAYTIVSTNVGYAAFPATVGSGYYTLTVTSVNPLPTATLPADYTVTATYTALGNQTADTQCATFQATSTGVQSSFSSTNVDTTATCWR